MAEHCRYDTLLVVARAMTPATRKRLLARSWPRTAFDYAEWERAVRGAEGLPLLSTEETAALLRNQRVAGEVSSG